MGTACEMSALASTGMKTMSTRSHRAIGFATEPSDESDATAFGGSGTRLRGSGCCGAIASRTARGRSVIGCTAGCAHAGPPRSSVDGSHSATVAQHSMRVIWAGRAKRWVSWKLSSRPGAQLSGSV